MFSLVEWAYGVFMKFLKKHNEVDAIKVEISEIKSQLNEVLLCLPEREKAILDAIESGRQNDLATSELIREQEKAIARLDALNCEKQKTLSGMTKWIILVILGILSLTVRYTVDYAPGKGMVVKPDQNSGPIMPLIYTLSIIAVATGQDSKIGTIIDKLGAKIG
jgi:hypothetical protein